MTTKRETRAVPKSEARRVFLKANVQGVIWLLFLPWMICLWMWTLPLAMPIRLVLVIAALAWTNWLLWPWK